MHRISVDLPEPDGPPTTMTSWRPTFMLMSRSAWNEPKNSSTRSQLDDRFTLQWLRGIAETVDPEADPQLAFDALTLARHRVRTDPEQETR